MESESSAYSLPSWPAVTIHGLDDALTVLARGLPVVLLSAPGAALTGGVLWWRAVVADARATCPVARMIDILDCADAPGAAMAALRAGQRHLVLAANPAWDRVASAAAGLGAIVLQERPEALDLAQRGALRRLDSYLKAPSGAS
jgi:hypothetical protein